MKYFDKEGSPMWNCMVFYYEKYKISDINHWPTYRDKELEKYNAKILKNADVIFDTPEDEITFILKWT